MTIWNTWNISILQYGGMDNKIFVLSQKISGPNYDFEELSKHQIFNLLCLPV